MSIFIILLCLTKNWGLNDNTYNSPNDYIKAKKEIHAQYRIGHFPSAIPNKATNVVFHKSNGAFYKSEYIILKFNIDKKYIEDELKKHKFIEISPFSKDGAGSIVTDNGAS